MPVPALTPEQRQAALAKAAQARRQRADIKAKLKNGQVAVQDVLAMAQSDDAIAKMKVVSLLEALPGVGQARAQTIMQRAEISPTRRLRGLGDGQRVRLLAELGLG